MSFVEQLFDVIPFDDKKTEDIEVSANVFAVWRMMIDNEMKESTVYTFKGEMPKEVNRITLEWEGKTLIIKLKKQ